MPEGWQWERLGNVNTIARGGSPRPTEEFLTEDAEGINWIKIGDNTKNSKYILHTKEKIKPAGLSKTRYVCSDDFLLTNSMSFGRPYILKIDGCIHDGWLVICNIDIVFNQDYLYYALSSDFMYTTLSLLAAGATVKNLKSDTMRSVLFPIPPLGEQERMAHRLEQLIAFTDAIIFRGEDNSYYLKDGQLTVNINDALPFAIPDSWYWTRLKDVLLLILEIN